MYKFNKQELFLKNEWKFWELSQRGTTILVIILAFLVLYGTGGLQWFLDRLF